MVDSVVPLDERRLTVTLRQPQDSAPSILADPVFSLPVAAEQERTRIGFEELNGEDPRDALDKGADVLVTRDASVLEYVAARPEFVTFSLPWSRTYVLLEVGSRTDHSLSRITADPQVARSLADAAGVEARAAEPPFWWIDLSACRRGDVDASDGHPLRVAYPEGDEVARRLAERIVALTPPGTNVRTAALAPAELAGALRSGSGGAYVLPVPRQSLAPCRDASGWPRSASILPLIDSRASVIVRRGSPPLTVEWDGTLTIEDAADDHAP
jgi:hypothetical protein